MSSPSDEEKLKRILSTLNNTDIPLDTFYEQMEKEFGNSVPFSHYRFFEKIEILRRRRKPKFRIPN